MDTSTKHAVNDEGTVVVHSPSKAQGILSSYQVSPAVGILGSAYLTFCEITPTT